MLQKLRSLITSRNVGIFLFVITVAASVQKYFLYNINNYFIFSRSFGLLISHQNLYADHPELFNDRFLYSPTFALLMAAFYYLPDLAGVILWNLLNLICFFFAVKAIAGTEKSFVLILALVAVELFNSIQNTQSNPLVTAFILLAFVNFEKQKFSNAAIFVASLFFIKIYGFAAGIFAVFQMGKIKFGGWLIFWFALLFVLPLIIISANELGWQYENWFALINGFKTGAQYSVMGLIERYAGREIFYLPVQIIGLLIFLAPLIQIKKFSDARFRRRLLCSLLIFLVIFNQSAESPTYVTAVTGTAIWFGSSRKNLLDYILIFLVLVFTSLGSTSLFPSVVRHDFFEAYDVKVIPCLLVWLKIQYEMYLNEKIEDRRQQTKSSR